MVEKKFRKIAYFKKSSLDMSKFTIEPEAKAIIDGTPSEGNLVLRLRINSPVVIEAAAPLTPDGIKEITRLGA